MIRPRRLTPRWLLFLGALTALSVAAWVSAIAGAGSGTALITPSTPVAAGSTGKWSIVYTAAETIQNGRVRVTVPNGFGAPQTLSSSNEGYVSVFTDEPTGNPLVSVGGQVITIDVDTLTVGNTLTVVYGDDAGGASARATAATTIGSYTFVVASDPSGSSPSPIATSPALTVIADTPDHIEIAPSDTSVVAGTYAPYRLIVRDQYGNRAPVASSRTVNLFPGSGSFYTTPGHAPITSTTIQNGDTSVRIDYRGTLASPSGSPHSIFVFTPSGSPSLAGADDVHVTAAGLSVAQSTVEALSPVTANGTSQSPVTVTSKDQFGNPRSGDSATISVTGSAIKTGPSSQTDANGETSAIVTDTVAQSVTVTAQINSQAISDDATISFVAGPVSAATSAVTATSPVVANGIATS
ncbi:MAG TPA: Ig-like domain-containing protein, partial [Candidatus Krumholzibacteria bacterium]|nr:Ig-like domain-containing protein [Candidatus Krumholzibacteria bacterium]